MVVSTNTATEVLNAIEKYMVDRHQIVNLLNDLSKVEGNQSYKDTIQLLRSQYIKELKAAARRL